MDDSAVNKRSRGMGMKVALVGAGLAAGAIAATAIGANAANTTSGSGTGANGSTTSSTGTSSTGNSSSIGLPDGARDDHFDHGGPHPVRDDEKSVSASLAAKLKASALKAVPGGTVYRVESDAGDGTYEAHMTKANGSLVTVKFDKNGNVTKVEDGMGTGDPRH